jgi:hypothetical protein
MSIPDRIATIVETLDWVAYGLRADGIDCGDLTNAADALNDLKLELERQVLRRSRHWRWWHDQRRHRSAGASGPPPDWPPAAPGGGPAVMVRVRFRPVRDRVRYYSVWLALSSPCPDALVADDGTWLARPCSNGGMPPSCEAGFSGRCAAAEWILMTAIGVVLLLRMPPPSPSPFRREGQ